MTSFSIQVASVGLNRGINTVWKEVFYVKLTNNVAQNVQLRVI